MRVLFSILLFTISGFSLSAQFSQSNAVYLSTEANVGNYFGIDINLNYVIRENFSIRAGYMGNIRKPKSQPADYSSGFIGVFALGLANPWDALETFQLSAGKVLILNSKRTIRSNLSIGLGYSIVREATNWRKLEDHYLDENYHWDYQRSHVVSLVINPKFEFPVSQVYGLTVSPMVVINSKSTYFGIGLGQMLGLLRS